MGRRESEVRCLRPLLSQSHVAAMSSDHTLLVAGSSLHAGDTVDFALDYEGLVRAVTSPFVRKVFAEGHYCDGSAPWTGADHPGATSTSYDCPRPGDPYGHPKEHEGRVMKEATQ
jgi:hypothetical protein